MRPDAQAEYDRICTQITLQHGHVVSHNPSVYGWRLQRRMRYVHADGHIPGCTVLSHGNATEDHWEEFVGTFAEPTCETRHGFSVANVTCSCGFIQDRTVRYEGSVSEMTRAVFEYMFSEKGNSDVHQK